VLLERYARLLQADRQNLALLLGQAPIIGAILALLFEPDLFGLSQEFSDRGLFPIQDGQTLLFLLMMSCLMFGVINSCREVVKELPIFRRERLVNLQLLPYLLSKVLLLGLLGLAQSGVLLATILLRIPLEMSPSDLLLAFLFLFAACLGGILMGLVMSSLTASAEQAMSLVSVVLILQLVFSGAFIRTENMTEPLNTMSLLAVSRWGFAGLASLARLNERLQELGLPWAGVDFSIPAAENFGVLVPVLALHFVLAAVALRWRESRS
jgi:ABC-type multidrug transport system permease subunit